MLNYGYEKNGSTHHKEWDKRYQRTIHILVTQRHQVFVAVTHPREDVEISNWVNSSNHDSCWKSDGLNIFEKVAWDAYEHCFAFMPDEHRPAPIAAHTFTQFADWHFGRLPFEIVKVKGKYGGDYRNFLTEIKKVDYQINILDPEVHTENDNEIL